MTHLQTPPPPSFAPGQSHPFLGLAPMAGLTDWPMRVLCYRMGADYACTEMVSAMGYLCAKPGNPAYARLLETHPQESNTACQLFGRDPVALSEAAARITEMGRFTSIDLNMGCPARKVTSSGEGSALLKTPDLAFRLMEAVKKSTCLPVTLKTRLGYDEHSMNALELVRAAESLRFAWVCLHGRTREQQYSGRADYAAIGAIRAQVAIPILANGDVFAPDDAPRILRETGCQGLLVGRGALGNPWLFGKAKAALKGRPHATETLAQRLETVTLHAEMTAAFKGESLGVVEMRKHIGHYVSGMSGAAAMRRELNSAKTIRELTTLLRRLFQTAED